MNDRTKLLSTRRVDNTSLLRTIKENDEHVTNDTVAGDTSRNALTNTSKSINRRKIIDNRKLICTSEVTRGLVETNELVDTNNQIDTDRLISRRHCNQLLPVRNILKNTKTIDTAIRTNNTDKNTGTIYNIGMKKSSLITVNTIPTLISTNKTLELNVGGMLYTISQKILYVNLESVLLDINGKKDSAGRIFIDRDGSLFSYVLTYLQTGHVTFPDNFAEIKRLRNEAIYYRLPELIELIENQIYVHDYKGSYITVTAQSTFKFGRRDKIKVTFKRSAYLLVSGYVPTCKKVFGICLCLNRDRNYENDRYSCRMILSYTNMACAFQALCRCGYVLVTCNESDAAKNSNQKRIDEISDRWIHCSTYIFKKI